MNNYSSETFKVKKIYLRRVLKGSCQGQKPINYYQEKIDLIAKGGGGRYPLVIESRNIKILIDLHNWIKDNYPELFKETSFEETIKDY